MSRDFPHRSTQSAHFKATTPYMIKHSTSSLPSPLSPLPSPLPPSLQITGLQGNERFSAQVLPSPAMEGLQARGGIPSNEPQKPSTLPINPDQQQQQQQQYPPMQYPAKSLAPSSVSTGGLALQTPNTPLAPHQVSRADIASHGSNSPSTSHIYSTTTMAGTKAHMTQTPTQHRAYTTPHLSTQTPTSSWGSRNLAYQGASPTHGFHGSGGGTPYGQPSSVDPRYSGYQYGGGVSGSAASASYNPSVSAGEGVRV